MYVILAGVVIAAMTTGLGTLARLTTPAKTLLVLERAR
jgi:putative ABC transport system permease protein